MSQGVISKPYNLEERTFLFARRVRSFIRSLPRTFSQSDDCKQLLRSSGSVGANYIEANEALSKRDFSMRIMICRKEAKESQYWLRLLEAQDETLDKERKMLLQESIELTKIFGSIVEKSK